MKHAITIFAAIMAATLVADAGLYRIGGFTFDEQNVVRTAAVVEGPVTVSVRTSRNFARYSEEYIASSKERINEYRDFNRKNSIGWLLGRGGNPDYARHVSLAAPGEVLPMVNLHRTTLELTWAGYGLPNRPGPDFVVYEIATWQGFSASARKEGSKDFSAPVYQFPAAQDKAQDVNAVAFELSDFGFAEGDICSAIRLRNIFSGQARSGADRVDNESGQGKILYPSDPNYKTGFPLRTKAGGPEFNVEQLNADIVYAVGLHDIVPLKVETTETVGK
jgi:hypothetical protein